MKLDALPSTGFRPLQRAAGLLPAALIVWASVVSGSVARAQQQPPMGTAAERSSAQVSIGIDGQYRIGRWTAVRVDGVGASDKDSVPLTLQTVDGDGVRIDYADAPLAPQGGVASPWRYLIPGGESAPLVIARSDAAAAEKPLWSGRFPDASIAASKPWAIVFGDPLGVDVLGRNELLGREANVTTTVIRQAAMLPDHWLGYDAVDLMIVNGSALPLLGELNDAQTEALHGWVRGGGRVLITLGPSAAAATGALPLLKRWLPLADQQPLRTVLYEPAAIEAFLSAGQPIRPFEGVVLPTQQGRPLLTGRTSSRQTMPLIMQYPVGFGHVTAVAADLDAPPFVDWSQRTNLIGAVMPGLTVQPPATGATQRRGDIGYDDMAGQVRATLDRFPAAHTASFSMVALVILAVLVLIGPVDFLLVNHWLGRPLLGWLSFPLTIFAFSGLLIAWASGGPTRPTIQRLEVTDIDTISGFGRGFTWGQIYSPSAGRFDVHFQHSGGLAVDASAPILTAPFGTPGPAFGSLQVAGEDHRLPGYANRMQRTETALGSRLQDVPLAPASSKGVAAWWRFQPRLGSSPQLSVRRGRSLQGRLVNPLPVDLLDGVLLYGDWAYFLPTRLRAGGTIEAVETLRQKTFRWHLTHRTAVTGSSESEDWNAAMDHDLQRVSEILLFYETAGGEEYTGLSNRPLRQLDLGSQLEADRAMLVGRLDQPAASLTIEGPMSPVELGRTVSVVRVVVPVERGQ